MMTDEPIGLKNAGATWWHTHDHHSPNLSKASMGTFFNSVLTAGAHVGEVWVFNNKYKNSAVYVSLYMTEEMKNTIEANTKFRFNPPPVITLN